jgi:hypothetical protein
VYIPVSAILDATGATTLGQAMEDLSSGTKLHDLSANLLGSDMLTVDSAYHAVNIDGGIESHAFNPYPYSMVFSVKGAEGVTKNTDSNHILYSSVYNNSEAYVYFSPQSMYKAYTSLRDEYNSLVKKSSDDRGTIAVLGGYYLAAMAICEAYLSEALPQDMTRGYVGPAETDDSLSLIRAKQSNNSTSMKNVPYFSLYYSVNSDHSETSSACSGPAFLPANSIMSTLSVYGYQSQSDIANMAKTVGGAIENTQGPMSGLTLAGVHKRRTIFSPDDSGYTAPDYTYGTVHDRYGMYTPLYYPIQSHAMKKDPEAKYRFQITNAISYDTFINCISAEEGLYGGSLSTSSAPLLDPTNPTALIDTVSDNVRRWQAAYDSYNGKASGSEYSLSNVKTGNSSVLSRSAVTTGTNAIAQRFDAAINHYVQNTMDPENERDFVDIIRNARIYSVTWCANYNPIKNNGSSATIYLARVTPSLTTYMPGMLMSGYRSAGCNSKLDASKGNSLAGIATDTAQDNYFSIPSLGPCLAAHSLVDNYYGAMNYEQNGFYMGSFLDAVTTTEAPAADAYEQVKKAIEDVGTEVEERKGDFYVAMALAYGHVKEWTYYEVVADVFSGKTIDLSNNPIEITSLDPILADAKAYNEWNPQNPQNPKGTNNDDQSKDPSLQEQKYHIVTLKDPDPVAGSTIEFITYGDKLLYNGTTKYTAVASENNKVFPYNWFVGDNTKYANRAEHAAKEAIGAIAKDTFISRWGYKSENGAPPNNYYWMDYEDLRNIFYGGHLEPNSLSEHIKAFNQEMKDKSPKKSESSDEGENKEPKIGYKSDYSTGTPEEIFDDLTGGKDEFSLERESGLSRRDAA